MDKSEGKDLIAKTLNRVTEETAKVYKISRLKIEVATLGRSKNEKMNMLSRKLVELIKNGEVDHKLFEPEYSSIMEIDAKIDELDKEGNEIKHNLNLGFGKKEEPKEKQVAPKCDDIEPEDITPDQPKKQKADEEA